MACFLRNRYPFLVPRYRKVYESQAGAYEALVSKEDYQGNILPALDGIVPIAGKEIMEFGAGTGRLTRLLAPRAKSIQAFDAYPAMIAEARARLSQAGLKNVSFAIAENKAIPLERGSADMSIAGWTFGHCTSWYPETWKAEIAGVLDEMRRLTRESGTAVILETLGTGQESPAAPNDRLSEYYAYLERGHSFARSWVRTDYRFESKAQADSLTLAFFGKSFPVRVQPDGSAILPECTGIWHRSFQAP